MNGHLLDPLVLTKDCDPAATLKAEGSVLVPSYRTSRTRCTDTAAHLSVLSEKRVLLNFDRQPKLGASNERLEQLLQEEKEAAEGEVPLSELSGLSAFACGKVLESATPEDVRFSFSLEVHAYTPSCNRYWPGCGPWCSRA